jgi:hypothetical protein
MGANRIRVAKDKADLVKSLVDLPSTTGPFPTYADVMVFAASLGAKRKKRSPLGTIAKEPSPIALDVFVSRGYDRVLKLPKFSLPRMKSLRRSASRFLKSMPMVGWIFYEMSCGER